MALTYRRKLFVIYYLGKAQGNGTLAATMAGFRDPASEASNLLKNPKISQAIAAHLDKAAMSAEETLVRISRLAAIDVGNFLSFNPDADPQKDPVPVLDLRKARRRDQLCGIKKIKAVDRPNDLPRVFEVEVNDPIKALALLAKYHGLVDTKVDEKSEEEKKPRIVLPSAKHARPRQVDPN
jgi:hypothetical protein